MCFLKHVFKYFKLKLAWHRYMKIKSRFRTQTVKKQRQTTSVKRAARIAAVQRAARNWKKKVLTIGTFDNFIVMAILGLLTGIVITFIQLYSVLYRGQESFLWCFLLRMPVLVAVTCFLAFSWRARCFLLLAPIQMFSSSGTHLITGHLVVMTAMGPMDNLRHNIEVLQESASCQQRGVMAAAADIADILFGPFTSFKQAAAQITKGIKVMVEKLQRILTAFKRTVTTVASAIQDAARWINSKINSCRTTVGSTHDHCIEAFSWMHDECKVKVPAIFSDVCSVTGLASNLCSAVKPGEYLCDLVSYTVDPLVTTINQRIRRLWDRAYTLFYFEVNIHHEFTMDDNSHSIAQELKNKLLSFLENSMFTSVEHWAYSAVGVFVQLNFVWRMFRYYRLYQRREEADNYFINDRLQDIDIQETLKGEESIFPLKRVEKNKYVRIDSFSLTKKEMKIYKYSFIGLAKSGLYLTFIGLDYVLYYILDKTRVFMIATMQTYSTRTEISVEGSGFIAELSRRVVRALNNVNSDFFQTHMMPCVPNPKHPNTFINKLIYFCLFLYWFTWLTKPYVLRGRHVLMDWYFPEQAEKRAVWLYKKISLKRTTFMSLIRMKMRSKMGRNVNKTVLVVDLLRARWPWLTHIIGKGSMVDQCSVCGHLRPPLYHCPTQDCPAVYCDDCYMNVQGNCCLCTQPMMISDFKNINLASKEDVLVSNAEEEDEYSEIEGLELWNSDFTYQGGKARAWEPNYLQKRFESFERRANVQELVETLQ